MTHWPGGCLLLVASSDGALTLYKPIVADKSLATNPARLSPSMHLYNLCTSLNFGADETEDEDEALPQVDGAGSDGSDDDFTAVKKRNKGAGKGRKKKLLDEDEDEDDDTAKRPRRAAPKAARKGMAEDGGNGDGVHDTVDDNAASGLPSQVAGQVDGGAKERSVTTGYTLFCAEYHDEAIAVAQTYYPRDTLAVAAMKLKGKWWQDKKADGSHKEWNAWSARSGLELWTVHTYGSFSEADERLGKNSRQQLDVQWEALAEADRKDYNAKVDVLQSRLSENRGRVPITDST